MKALITGAADGIGRALAFACGQADYDIVGVDVDEARAHQTASDLDAAGIFSRFLQCDLADTAQVTNIISQLSMYGPYDLVIHNAGISAVGRFEEIDPKRQQAVMAINLMAPMLLTAGLLTERQINANGALIFISSLSHFAGYPGAAVYAATKDGIASYARSLRVGLAAQHVHVLTVFPGPTRTAHARRYSPDNSREHTRMSPEDLARQILRALQHRQWTLIPGIGNRIFALAGRVAPRLVEAVMRKSLYEKLT
ncbi:SDR family NAD(P)-dependent oxidoreductase [bacterium]|nr:SDR family NAD(P)-dependent oxidoreductase [bacterium]